MHLKVRIYNLALPIVWRFLTNHLEGSGQRGGTNTM
jgi:hypothetical protein